MAIISVIIPIYNVEKYLKRCLNSVINQTFSDIEIICIDDGSTDGSLAILNEYAMQDSRIKVLSQSNAGVSAARNKGMDIATGDYISFIDSDDSIELSFFERLYNAANENNSDIAVASIVRKKQSSENFRINYNSIKKYTSLQDKINICKIPDCSYVWNKLYKADLVKNFRFSEGVYFEDIQWLPEVVKSANSVITVDKTYYTYFKNPNSIVVRCPSYKKQDDCYKAKKYIVEFFEKNNLELAEHEKNISKRVKFICGVPLYKIKEYNNVETVYLFGFIPVLKYQTSGKRIIVKFLGIKLTINKNKLSSKQITESNASYENGTNKDIPIVKNVTETINDLVAGDKSIVRYGDGEFNLIFGESIPFQKYNLKLQMRLKEILISDNENILTGIPDIFGSLTAHKKDHQMFWRKYIVNYRQDLYKILNFNKEYCDSIVSRLYMEYIDSLNHKDCFDRLKTIWQDRDVVFVEGAGTRLGYKNDLFSNTKSIKRIICPAKDAFEKYDAILEECKKISKDKLFIIALGPTATVLAYDLSNLGYRALDLGHIDIEYEWFLCKAKEKIAIKDKFVNEVKNGRIVTSLTDEGYLSEIITDIENREKVNAH